MTNEEKKLEMTKLEKDAYNKLVLTSGEMYFNGKKNCDVYNENEYIEVYITKENTFVGCLTYLSSEKYIAVLRKDKRVLVGQSRALVLDKKGEIIKLMSEEGAQKIRDNFEEVHQNHARFKNKKKPI